VGACAAGSTTSPSPGWLRRFWEAGAGAVGALVLPWECPVCGGEGEGDGAPFCGDCRAELLEAAGAACPRCASPVGSWGVRAEGRRRVRATALSAGLGRAERAEMLRGAFRVRRAPGLHGRTVFLVDDVLTTGATCGAAARALKGAGAARVVAVVVARA